MFLIWECGGRTFVSPLEFTIRAAAQVETWLSLIRDGSQPSSPQRSIIANFDDSNKLSYVHVKVVCGADESGWQIPLRTEATEKVSR